MGPGLLDLMEEGLDLWVWGRRGWSPGPLGLREEGLGVWTPGSDGGGAGVLNSYGSSLNGRGVGTGLLDLIGVGAAGLAGWGPGLLGLRQEGLCSWRSLELGILGLRRVAGVQNYGPPPHPGGRIRTLDAKGIELQYPCCQSEDGAGSPGVERPGWGFRARF